MTLSLFGNIRQAFSFWGQALLVLCKNPILLVVQVAAACLLTLVRISVGRFDFPSALISGIFLFIPSLIVCLYVCNAFFSHYTMHYVQNQRARCKESFFAAFRHWKQFFVYLFLCIPVAYFFLYPPVYGQKLFFASLGVGESAQHINNSVARILFILLVVLLLCIFIVQHLASVIVWVSKNSCTQAAKLALHLMRHNKVIVVSLTGLLVLTGCLLLFFVTYIHRSTDFVIPNLLRLTMGYYVIIVPINLYCMALTIFYYEYYVKPAHTH